MIDRWKIKIKVLNYAAFLLIFLRENILHQMM